jgi:hypothetical protein
MPLAEWSAPTARDRPDFLKPYARLTRECYEALAIAGEEQGMRLMGHVPEALSLHDVLERPARPWVSAASARRPTSTAPPEYTSSVRRGDLPSPPTPCKTLRDRIEKKIPVRAPRHPPRPRSTAPPASVSSS